MRRQNVPPGFSTTLTLSGMSPAQGTKIQSQARESMGLTTTHIWVIILQAHFHQGLLFPSRQPRYREVLSLFSSFWIRALF